jgi:rubredoxin
MRALCLVAALVLAALVLSWLGRDRFAYNVLQIGGHMLEPEPARDDGDAPLANPAARGRTVRPYLSPYIKKQIAAQQQWRCAVCKTLFDASYEIDHKKPLHHAKNDAETKRLNEPVNLQALCRKCHLAKSAMEAQL